MAPEASPPLPLLLLLLLLLPGRALALDASLEPPNTYPSSEEGARLFASDYNTTGETVFFQSVSASWTYNTNLTDFNAQGQV